MIHVFETEKGSVIVICVVRKQVGNFDMAGKVSVYVEYWRVLTNGLLILFNLLNQVYSVLLS